METKEIFLLPPSTFLGLKTNYCAARILEKSDSPVKAKQLLQRIKETLIFSDWENEATKSGKVRWKNQYAYHAIAVKKAGLVESVGSEGLQLTNLGRSVLKGRNIQLFFDIYWGQRSEERAAD